MTTLAGAGIRPDRPASEASVSSCGSPSSPRAMRSRAVRRSAGVTASQWASIVEKCSSSVIGIRACARIAPASKSGVSRWIVSPVSVSPLRKAQPVAFGPR